MSSTEKITMAEAIAHFRKFYPETVAAIEAGARASERERVHAAVLALTPHVHGVPMVTLYEVVGVIDAEATQDA